MTREAGNSYVKLESAQVRVKAIREAAVQFKEILRSEQAKCEIGRTVIYHVLEAEVCVLNSQSLLLHAERSEAMASLAMKLAAGQINVDSPGTNP